MNNDEEILELVANGDLDPDDIDDFRDLDDDVQEMVANGEIDIDEAREF